jgi:predicted lipid-binding transport protein (Tim44 family)
MKTLITCLSAMVLLLGMVNEAQAKRFGSGGFGKAFPTKTAPAPQKQTPQKSTPDGAQQAAPAKGGLMGGMLGGLLAGGLFAYLLGSGAFEGLQLMDILLFAGIAFLLFKLLKGASRPQHRAATSAGPQTFQAEAPFSGSSAPADHSLNEVNLPDGFDADVFIAGALEHYRLVQQAWNEGNLDLIREYVSPELYAALAAQRNRLMVPPQTEILDLDASIVRADGNATHREISILFKGRCKDELEKSEDGIFDVWHLERDMREDDSPWIVVGIEAEG